MNALTLTLKKQPPTDLDCSTLRPDLLGTMTLEAIRALPLACGKAKHTVADLFEVEGQPGAQMVLRNASPRFIRVGFGMTGGSLRVEGDTGDLAGAHMSGGTLALEGNAGHRVGAAMTGGRIDVRGNVGDRLGGFLNTDPQGMSGGVITVGGNAGDRVGERMRRGICVIHGGTGLYCGASMVAGSIVVLGEVGDGVGCNMRRGSILLAKAPGRILPTFNPSGHLKIGFLSLLFRHLAEAGIVAGLADRFGTRCLRYAGDLGRGGKGEIVVLEPKGA
jgi:formylmethanofuran dehydrogenase subunit C